MRQADTYFTPPQFEGVSQNYGEALKWYRQSASQGNASAQFNLGAMYANGEGVPQDYQQAFPVRQDDDTLGSSGETLQYSGSNQLTYWL